LLIGIDLLLFILILIDLLLFIGIGIDLLLLLLILILTGKGLFPIVIELFPIGYGLMKLMLGLMLEVWTYDLLWVLLLVFLI